MSLCSNFYYNLFFSFCQHFVEFLKNWPVNLLKKGEKAFLERQRAARGIDKP